MPAWTSFPVHLWLRASIWQATSVIPAGCGKLPLWWCLTLTATPCSFASAWHVLSNLIPSKPEDGYCGSSSGPSSTNWQGLKISPQLLEKMNPELRGSHETRDKLKAEGEVSRFTGRWTVGTMWGVTKPAVGGSTPLCSAYKINYCSSSLRAL